MLSEKKSVIRFAELVAIASTFAVWFLAFSTWRAPSADFPVFLWASIGMAATMVTFGPACMLAGEYGKATKEPPKWFRSHGLSARDISFLIHWSPALYKAAAIASVLLMVATALQFGRISFREGQPIDPEKVPGMFLALSVFYLFALPVLGSASRMPGSYASELARLKAAERRSSRNDA
jgi:hypothetical protein